MTSSMYKNSVAESYVKCFEETWTHSHPYFRKYYTRLTAIEVADNFVPCLVLLP